MGNIKKDDSKIPKKELEEINRILSNEVEEKVKDAKIFYDGKQYNVRIPAKFAKDMEIDPSKDVIRFTLNLPSNLLKEKPKLNIELIKK